MPSNLEYRPTYDEHLEPGLVIYIHDKDKQGSRMDARIMLVIKNCLRKSYNCVSFCRHEPAPYLRQDIAVHRHVYQVNSPHSNPSPARKQAIGIELLRDDMSLQAGITINLEEIYNVKPELTVKIGRAHV